MSVRGKKEKDERKKKGHEKGEENEQECGVNESHVDCSDAFNTSQVMMFI